MLFSDVEAEINSKLYKNECGEWVCTDCGYTKKIRSHVYEHVDRKHGTHGGYLCNICNTVLSFVSCAWAVYRVGHAL